jgi:hypothetical protein
METIEAKTNLSKRLRSYCFPMFSPSNLTKVLPENQNNNDVFCPKSPLPPSKLVN